MAKFETADGVSINYTDHGGDGQTVVLVHGITEVSATWDPVTDLLKQTNRVVTMDLRGHGDSGTADAYDIGSMAGDVVGLAAHLGLAEFQLVGHSLGGAVVSAAGPLAGAKTVMNVDQSLQLGEFKEMLGGLEDQLRDPEAFPLVMGAVFDQLMGEVLSDAQKERINSVRMMSQDVVLGVWDMIFKLSVDEINEVIDGSFAPYAESNTPYLSLFGIDPGPDYGAWLGERIPGATVEVWQDNGHYVHLVDPERFVARAAEFWANN